MASEAEVLEYLLGLDTLGLGAKAFGIYERAQWRDVMPLLARQQALLERADMLDGFGPLETWKDLAAASKRKPPKSTEAVALDEQVKTLKADIAAAWERCLEQLKVLWLTEGRPLLDTPP